MKKYLYTILALLNFLNFANSQMVYSLQISDDQKHVITGCDDSKAIVFNLETNSIECVIQEASDEFSNVSVRGAFLYPDKSLLTISGVGTIAKWNITTGKPNFRVKGEKGDLASVYTSSVGSIIYTTHSSPEGIFFKINSTNDGALIKPYKVSNKSSDWIASMGITNIEGKFVVGLGFDKILLKDFEKDSILWQIKEKAADIRLKADYNSFVYYNSEDRTIKIRELKTAKLIKSISLDSKNRVVSSDLSPNEKYWVYGVEDQGTFVIDLETGKVISKFKSDIRFGQVKFLSDNIYFVANGYEFDKVDVIKGKSVYHNDFSKAVKKTKQTNEVIRVSPAKTPEYNGKISPSGNGKIYCYTAVLKKVSGTFSVRVDYVAALVQIEAPNTYSSDQIKSCGRSFANEYGALYGASIVEELLEEGMDCQECKKAISKKNQFSDFRIIRTRMK